MSVLAGGVAVAGGLSPYLGLDGWDVPLFDDWLAVIPVGRHGVIRWSAVLMGLTVGLLWHGRDSLTALRMKRLVRRSLIGAGISAGILLAIQFRCVVPIPARELRVLVGFTTPATCAEDQSRKDCLADMTLDRDEMVAAWGEDELTLVEWLYTFSYLSLSGCLAALVATLSVREWGRRRQREPAPSGSSRWPDPFAVPTSRTLPKPIFVSYRRDDSAGTSGRLYDALEERYGWGAVFFDVETIRPGKDFVQAIDEAVSSAGLVVVVIGPDWLRRGDHPGPDYVAHEVSAALRLDIPILPVLVEGGRMPIDELPAEIRGLATRNALKMEHERWNDDLRRLLDCVDELVAAEG